MLVEVVVLLAASAVQATETSAAVPANQVPAAKERKVCRTDQLIGSMIPKRVCKTKSEWDGQAGAKPSMNNAHDQPQPPQPTGSGNNN